MALRERWLNPPEWVEWVEEPARGYPKRPVARDETAAKALKHRTLTKHYNARPKWLDDALGAAAGAERGGRGCSRRCMTGAGWLRGAVALRDWPVGDGGTVVEHSKRSHHPLPAALDGPVAPVGGVHGPEKGGRRIA